jgi:hypothetical protein
MPLLPAETRPPARTRENRGREEDADMEAVVLDENGRSGFQALPAALGEGGRRDRVAAYVF